MANLPPISSLGLEGMLTDGEIDPQRLLFGLNQFLGPTYQALNGQLSVENMRAEWLEYRLAVPSSAGAVRADYTTGSAQEIDDASLEVVNFGTAVEDTHSAVTTGAAWKFTVPTGLGGRYLVTCALDFSGSPDPHTEYICLMKGGNEFRRFTRLSCTGDSQILGHTGAVALTLAAADYIQIGAYQNSGGGLNTVNEATSNWIHITRLEDEGAQRSAASCFPFHMALRKLVSKPRAVILADCVALPEGGTTLIPCRWPQWTFTVKDSRPHITIKNIPGLPASTNLKLTFLVIGD